MIESTLDNLPPHLKKYIVEQNYSRYTSQDQAVWRYCLRQLKKFLMINGHSSYIDGLKKTGISIDKIPLISEISEQINKFGWKALPVSGFIPPAAFMELQSLQILPIATDMRTIDHLLYTPAPDIVHEAAGHAPILSDSEYSDYLSQYSQVAKKSIISKEDLDLYEAIRELSDLKENPNSKNEEILKSEKKLTDISKNMSHTSEASQLSRMNWWTAEYGLIGNLNHPKIFGAGLLSSVGESRLCLSDKVKKIPLTIDCIYQSYDITEPQPQLFVTPDFKTLVQVLKEFASTMSYQIGGTQGLDKAILAKSVNTIELESGFQISGICTDYITNSDNQIIFIKLSGPTQISYQDKEVSGHSKHYHIHGYSTPLGKFILSSDAIGDKVTAKYRSGFKIEGVLKKIYMIENGEKIYQFTQATATYENQIYFQPDWGDFDVVSGNNVVSVFGGPADRSSYGETIDFKARLIPQIQYSPHQLKLFESYQKIRDIRNQKTCSEKMIYDQFIHCKKLFAEDWLLFIELLELSLEFKLSEKLCQEIKMYLLNLKILNPDLETVVTDGILAAYE